MRKLIIVVSFFLVLICFSDAGTEVGNMEPFRKRIVALLREESLDVNILRGTIQAFNLNEEDARNEINSLVRQYKNASEDFSGGKTEVQRNSDAFYCLSLLQVLAKSGDRKNLPLFEEMAISSNDMVRFNGYIAYVRVVGTDAVPFIEKIIKTPHFNGLDQYRIYRVLGEQIKKEKKESPDKDLSKQYAYLLAKAVHTEIRSDIIDKILCENLPEYSTSIQRELAAETMMKSSNDYLRGMGDTIKSEIEKAPRKNRKDFKSKGELLDPDRNK